MILIGFMGSGKSAVGRRAAFELGLPFVDTDALIEAEAGRSIRSLFEEDGELAFRDLESRVVERVAAGPVSVIATGGGAVIRPSNLDALRRNGLLIHLAVDGPTVLKCTGGRADRPLLAGADDPLARIEAMMASRTPVYARADASITTTDVSIELAAFRAIQAWKRLGGSAPRGEEIE